MAGSIANIVIENYGEEVYRELKSFASELQKKIGYHFIEDDKLLSSILVRGGKYSTKEFERLEFLGDSILGAIVGLELYNSKGNANPKKLTDYRSNHTNNKSLSHISQKLGLKQIGTILGIGTLSEGQLADMFEALIGAIFLDAKNDLQKTRDVISPFFDFEKEIQTERDPKGRLISLAKKKFKTNPNFQTRTLGSQNAPEFVTTIKLSTGEEVLSIEGRAEKNKKAAEKAAAEKFLKEYGELLED